MQCYERIPSYSLTSVKDLMNAQAQVCVLEENLSGFFLCKRYIILGYVCYELETFVCMFQYLKKQEFLLCLDKTYTQANVF